MVRLSLFIVALGCTNCCPVIFCPLVFLFTLVHSFLKEKIHFFSSLFLQEHVLDEVDDQIEEMTWRVETLFGSDPSMDSMSYSDDFLSCLSLEDSEDDAEYLYRADRPSVSSGSGYESDHSTMSAVRWQFSSSSSHDISDESSRPEQQVSSRPVACSLGGAKVHGISDGFGPGSCSSFLTVEADIARRRTEASRRNACFIDDSDTPTTCTEHGYEGSIPTATWDIPGTLGNTNVLRDIVLRDSDFHDGVLRDKNWRDDHLRNSTVSSDRAASQNLSSSSGHSLRMRSQPVKEPIKPKAMYGLARGQSLRGPESFPEMGVLSPRPNPSAEGNNSETATNSSSDQEAGVGVKKPHSRKAKGLFRSSAVSPCSEGSGLALSPPLPNRASSQAESGSGDSGVQSAWGPAPSVSERGLVGSPDSAVSDRPLKGLLGDISMNRKLGTEITNDCDDMTRPNSHD